MSYRLCCGVLNASQITLPTCSNGSPASVTQVDSLELEELDCLNVVNTQSKEPSSFSAATNKLQAHSAAAMEPSKPPGGKGKSFWSRFKRKKSNGGAAKCASDPEEESCVCTGFNHLGCSVRGNSSCDLRGAAAARDEGCGKEECPCESCVERATAAVEGAVGPGEAWWNCGSTNLVVYHNHADYPPVRHGADTAETSSISNSTSAASSVATDVSGVQVLSRPNCVVRQCTLQPSDSGVLPQQATFTEFTQVEYVHCLVPDLECIARSCFYWGVMDRYEAEQLLDNKPEGTFLLRDSAQDDFLFSVSFRRYGRSLHARIDQDKHQFSFDIHDAGVFRAPTVCSLVEHYKDPSGCMFFEPMLSRPLVRNFPFSLKHLSRVAVCKHLGYDNVNQLPLPKKLMEYIKYYHYKLKVSERKLFTVVKSNGWTSRPLSLADLPQLQQND